jgi:hypothetical protein
MKPTATPSIRPSSHGLCLVNAAGDFGNVSNSKQAIFTDFKYGIITNSTVLNATGDSLDSVVHEVEISVTNLLLGDLFSTICASAVANDDDKRWNKVRFLASNNQVIGISSNPADVVLNGEYTKLFMFLNQLVSHIRSCHFYRYVHCHYRPGL